MKLEEIQKGMKVKAIKKSVNPESYSKFLELHSNAIGRVTSLYKNEGFVVVESFNFKPEDLILIDNPYTITKDLLVGMKVKVNTSGCECNECIKFFKSHPDGIGVITKIEHNIGNVYVDDVSFHESTIEPVDGKNKKEKVKDKIIIGVKQITIESLVRAGACENELSRFTKIVVDKSYLYSYYAIPPDYAQEVATQLGYPKWLEEHGFIEYQNKEIIQNIKVVRHSDSFRIIAELKDSSWYLFTIFKDGSGFYRFLNIEEKSGIKLDKHGIIKEVQNQEE